MRNYKGEGKIQNFAAPAGGVTSGVLALVGGTVCMPIMTVAVGVTFAAYVSGKLSGLPKTAGAYSALAGARAYWDSTTNLIEATDTATNRLIGNFDAAVLLAATAVDVNLLLPVGGDANADVAAKANKTAAAAGQIATLSAGGDLVAGVQLLTETPVILAADQPAGAGEVIISKAQGKGQIRGVTLLSALQLAAKLTTQDIVIALGSATTTTAANPAWVGATILAWSPLAGNDQDMVGASVGGDGAVTITVDVVETAAATFRVFARLA